MQDLLKQIEKKHKVLPIGRGTGWSTKGSSLFQLRGILKGTAWSFKYIVDNWGWRVWKSITPCTEFLVERSGKSKHVPHVGHASNIPTWQIAIKGIGTTKHTPHISHVGNIPTWQVAVKGIGMRKHHIHVSHLRNIPVRNVFVKSSLPLEQSRYVRDLGNTPRVYRPPIRFSNITFIVVGTVFFVNVSIDSPFEFVAVGKTWVRRGSNIFL